VKGQFGQFTSIVGCRRNSFGAGRKSHETSEIFGLEIGQPMTEINQFYIFCVFLII